MADRIISLNELAEKAGISDVNMSNIGQARSSAVWFSTLNSIRRVLKYQPRDLLEYVYDTEDQCQL